MKSILDMGRETQDPEMLGDDGAGQGEAKIYLWTVVTLILTVAGMFIGFQLVVANFWRIARPLLDIYGLVDRPGVPISRNPLTGEGFRFTLYCLTPLVGFTALCVLMWSRRPPVGEWTGIWKWPFVGALVVALPWVFLWVVGNWFLLGWAGPD
ncbi:hypothetical protein ACTXK0_05360 [Corynebacterium variabile]|uniref:hypothetical protein n=1 Tax=Corynebacterium variabile TaxID=1727 RepID=UPI003F929F5E